MKIKQQPFKESYMDAASITFTSKTSKAFPAIFWGGLICGTLDITSAFIINGNPIRLLQLIASGLLGTDSYNGGHATAILGMALHFLIAFTAAVIYHLASRKLKFLVQRPIVWGPLYGIAIYFFMHFIVLPLSAFPHKIAYTPEKLITGLIVHMLCVGLPISLANSRYSKLD